MTDRKISALPAATLPLVGSEQVPLVQEGETRRVPSNRLPQYRDRPLVYTPGNWYHFAGAPGILTANGSLPTGTLVLQSLFIPEDFLADQIGVALSTAPVGNVRFALYGVDATSRLPTGLPLLEAGPVTAGGSQITVALGAPYQLRQGLHWVGVQADGTATFRTASASSSYVFGGSSLNSATANEEKRLAMAFGPMPDLTGVSLTNSGQIRGGTMFFRSAV